MVVPVIKANEAVLSLDQALKTTGFAVFQDSSLVECGKFTVDASLSMGKRLAAFEENISKLLDSYDIRKLVFEQIQFQNGNAKTFQHLAYVQAILIYTCALRNIKYEIYEASHWRKVLGGKFGRKRNEQKAKAIDIVREKYQIDVDTDVADAICIGCAYLKEQKENQKGF